MVFGMSDSLPHTGCPKGRQGIARIHRTAIRCDDGIVLQFAKGAADLYAKAPQCVVQIGVHPGDENIILLFANRSPDVEIFASAAKGRDSAAQCSAKASDYEVSLG